MSHVQFFSKSDSEDGIKMRYYLTKLQTKLSWLFFMAHGVDVAYCYRPSNMYCQSLGPCVTVVSPAKTAELIEMPLGLRTRMGPRNHALDGSLDPMG